MSALNLKYFILGDENSPAVNPYAYGNAWFVDGLVPVATPDEALERIGSTDLRSAAVLEPADAEAVSGATCLWFIASEGFSILENVASMGVRIPGILMQALEIMRSKGEVPEKKAERIEEAEKEAEARAEANKAE